MSVEAFPEDCARAAIVVSPREAPGACAATLLDRNTWRSNGAMALRWTGEHFELSAARPPGDERPWARGLSGSAQTAPAARPALRDATPRLGEMDADH